MKKKSGGRKNRNPEDTMRETGGLDKAGGTDSKLSNTNKLPYLSLSQFGGMRFVNLVTPGSLLSATSSAQASSGDVR